VNSHNLSSAAAKPANNKSAADSEDPGLKVKSLTLSSKLDDKESKYKAGRVSALGVTKEGYL
jgi:hypothetical protein